ncbi:hypothetical protein [Streptomyces niveus]|uniref:hypothetical protein n=1 Tax=Streptomyces niveus TaxID=193462 RepID=UPI00193A3CEC|nr:hypothetical protein [Streptomyces niveus]
MDAPDIVVPVREGAVNEQLRYAVRSWAAHLPHGQVWVVGHRPSWLGGVRHLPTRQAGTKYQNTTAAVRAACAHPEVSDRFLLCNDDMFVMRQVTEMPVLRRGPVRDVEAYYTVRASGKYLRGMRETTELLATLGHRDPLSYELHVPLPTAKAGMLAALDAARHLDVVHKRTDSSADPAGPVRRRPVRPRRAGPVPVRRGAPGRAPLLLAGHEFPIRIVPDLDDFDARIRAHRPPSITVRADLDVDVLSRALAGLTGIAGRVAGALGGLLRFGAVGIAVAGAATAVVGLVGALAPAAGILAAFPALILGWQAALGTLRLALMGVSEAFGAALTGSSEKFTKALDDLSPAARAAALEVRALKPAFEALRNSVQDAFFSQIEGQAQHDRRRRDDARIRRRVERRAPSGPTMRAWSAATAW